MLNVLIRSKMRKQAAEALYAAVVTRAREPVFFARFGVPDTIDGRFDLMALHAWLVLAKIKQAPKDSQVSQAFIDRVFVGFEEALRDLGAGDIGMGRRMKKLADAFYGRLKAYEAAYEAVERGQEAELEAALVRNLYRGETAPCAGILAAYVKQARQAEDPAAFGPLPV